ncbi:MAG: hypothetical protein CVU56_15415 [Deltaproteobacteria bacterium HGW-Deltaproteobacteria-14]|jgi:hypothetical protein|nr:MAG: hypothetical protein CVU56_15415 [Deltaproteobacteria bacterium HGW-Deltaproteobacteria-14]
MKHLALLASLSIALLASGAPLSACSSRAPDAAASGANAAPGGLKPLMVGLADRLHALHDGLWREDLGAVGAAATAVAQHPKVSPEERGRIQRTLGEDFPRFAAADGQVHDAAVAIADAAAAKDLDGVVGRLGALEAGCVSCHTQFRARLRR